jgi:uncharacterized protein YbaP (TraB family)
MKKFFSSLLLVATVFATAWSQETQAPLAKSLLWQIDGPELDAPSYLYGTIHIIGKEDYFLTPEVEETFEKAEQVVFEIDMEDMNNMMVQFDLMMKMFMEDGKTLADLLSEEDYKVVSDHFASMGLPMMFLDRIKPLFLSVFAAGDPTEGGGLQGGGDMMSYEMEFTRMAQEKKKPISGLETIEFQMSVFDSIPYEAQAEMLVQSIKSEASGEGEYDMMIEMYKSQDVEAMQTSFTTEDSQYAQFEDVLLVKRNQNWIPIMQEMMGEGTTFFAVGAGHLGGPSGVIRLLQAEGYTLTPLHQPTNE